MNTLLTKYQRTIDQLPKTAKSLLLATILVMIFIIWYYGFWQDLKHSITTTSNQIAEINPLVKPLEIQLNALQKEINIKKEEFDKRSRLLIPSSTTTLISPHQMSNALHDILVANNKLVLLQLKNLAPKEIVSSQVNTKIFEHGIVIKFLGDYFSTMDYFQAIKNLKWKIFWDKLEYTVTKYPLAEITLYIHTISTTGDLIDV